MIKRCAILSTALFLIVLSAGAIWFWNTHRVLFLDFGPIGSGAPALTQSEIAQLLSDHYQIARHVRQIPGTLRKSFSNVTGLPFDMNNPGDPMSTDAIINAPSRQLIFAAVGERSAIVVYEQGSFASFPCAVILSKNGGAAWLEINGYIPTNVSALQRNVREGRFERISPSP